MSFEIYKNILTKEMCQELIDMVPTLSDNFITFTGVEVSRIIEPANRSPTAFYLHQLSEQESQKFCDVIYARIPNVKATAVRIIQYPAGSCILDHLDSWREIDGESNSGLIIQLNDPRSYRGGYLNIEREFIELDVGDGVYYGYEHVHGVSTVKDSERWVLNVRLYEEKSDARI